MGPLPLRLEIWQCFTLPFEPLPTRYSLSGMKYYWLSALALLALVMNTPGQSGRETAPFEWGPGLKVLIIGGGFAHDYQTFDNKFDTDLLRQAGITAVHYTEDPDVAARELPHADVLLLSNNHMGFDTPAFREAVSNFISAGKGLVPLHSGTFYAWKWDAYYTNYVGGGAHGHDGVSQFDETIIKEHPVTHGLPASFPITDELYHIEPYPGATPMDILAEAVKPGGGKVSQRVAGALWEGAHCLHRIGARRFSATGAAICAAAGERGQVGLPITDAAQKTNRHSGAIGAACSGGGGEFGTPFDDAAGGWRIGASVKRRAIARWMCWIFSASPCRFIIRTRRMNRRRFAPCKSGWNRRMSWCWAHPIITAALAA